MISRGENQRTWRRTCPSATLSNTTSTWTDLSVNLSLHTKSLETNHLSHSMALVNDFRAKQTV
jgi:hypothetical protein